MPVNYRFDVNVIVIYTVGEYTVNDLRATLLNSLADPERPPGSFLLFNFGESQGIHTRPTEEIQTMTDFFALMGNRYNYRLAIASSHDLPYVLQHFVSVKSRSYGISSDVFQTFDEAREWLFSEYLSTSQEAQAPQIINEPQFR
jgi:hypothetical protein